MPPETETPQPRRRLRPIEAPAAGPHGISRDGIRLALSVKQNYKAFEPICIPGADNRILSPEHLLNRDIHLEAFEDPLPLALVACRDPEAPMALAAITRLSPLARDGKLVNGVCRIVGETTRHPEVRKAIDLVSEADFSPQIVEVLRRHAGGYVSRARKQYTDALRANLKGLLDGEIAPRPFVEAFFELTEAGNLRHEVRKSLVSSLLTSKTVRPSIKFLFLENFHRLPRAVRQAIVGDLGKAKGDPFLPMIKEELHWILTRDLGEEAVH